jgi:hypothetical protein
MGFFSWLLGSSDEAQRDRIVPFLANRANEVGDRRLFDCARIVSERRDLPAKNVPAWLRSLGGGELARAADDIERGRF